MGKKSKPPPPPTAPGPIAQPQDFGEAARTGALMTLNNARMATATNRWDEQGPNGSIRWTLRPGANPGNPAPGDFIRTTTLAPEQQALRDQSAGLSGRFGRWAGDSLDGFDTDATARDKLTEALYRRGTQFFDRRFGVDQSALEARLANMGLARGSAAWNNEMARFDENKNQAYADAADRAVISGEQQSQVNQQNAFSRILAALQAQRGGMTPDPVSGNTGSMANVAGPDLLGSMNSAVSAQATDYGQQLGQYNAEVSAINAQNAARAAPWNALTGLGSSFLLGGGLRK